MSDIGKARDLLLLVADELHKNKLKNSKAALHIKRIVAQCMHREKRRTHYAPVTSVRMTPALRRQIKQYALDNPHVSEHEIGNRFGVIAGRVSESLKD